MTLKLLLHLSLKLLPPSHLHSRLLSPASPPRNIPKSWVSPSYRLPHLSCYQLQSSNCWAKTLGVICNSFLTTPFSHILHSLIEALLVIAWKYVKSSHFSHLSLPSSPAPAVWAPAAGLLSVLFYLQPCLSFSPVLHSTQEPLKI